MMIFHGFIGEATTIKKREEGNLFGIEKMIGCKICILRNGLKGSELDKLPKTEEELYEHLENVHGIIVIREGETEAEARERCAKKGIVSDRTKCQCEDCKRLRGEI